MLKPAFHGGGDDTSATSQTWVAGCQPGIYANNGRLLMRRPLGSKPEQCSGRPPSRLARLSSSGRLCLTAELRETELPILWASVVASSLWLTSLECPGATPVRLRRTSRGATEAVFTGAPVRRLLREAGIRDTNRSGTEAVLVLVEWTDLRPEALLLQLSRAEVVRAWH